MSPIELNLTPNQKRREKVRAIEQPLREAREREAEIEKLKREHADRLEDLDILIGELDEDVETELLSKTERKQKDRETQALAEKLDQIEDRVKELEGDPLSLIKNRILSAQKAEANLEERIRMIDKALAEPTKQVRKEDGIESASASAEIETLREEIVSASEKPEEARHEEENTQAKVAEGLEEIPVQTTEERRTEVTRIETELKALPKRKIIERRKLRKQLTQLKKEIKRASGPILMIPIDQRRKKEE